MNLVLTACVVVVGCWLATGDAALAQEDRSGVENPATIGEQNPSALPGVFGEVLDVRVINLEVVVTDKQGTQILGLGSDDFELLVDGERVEIDYFTEVRGGVARDAASPEGSGSGLPGMPALAEGEPVGTSYLVFVDDYFSLKPDRNAVLDSLKNDVALLRPEDRMAIVSYDGEELEMLSSWTSLVRPLERAIDEAMFRPARGLERIVERRRYDFATFDAIDFGSPLDPDPELAATFRVNLSPEERAYVELLTEQLNRSIAAATATLRSFAKPPGRKVLLLLSGGWPFVPADYLLSDASRILFEKGGPFGSNLYRRLVETANVLGYTIYPVDLPGLDREILDVTRAETSGIPPNTVGSSGFDREGEVHGTLRYLAGETGGRALINAQRIGALQRVAEDVDSYYWLGFSPERARDDVSHDVEVRLANPAFEARTRGSYLDSSRQREVSMAVESTLLFGNAAAAGTLGVEVMPAVAAGRKRMEVPIKVSIPLEDVTILPAGTGFATQLELRIAVQDDSGQQAPIPVVPWTLEFAEMPPGNAVGTYTTTLLLRRSRHEAVVAVHDPVSGKIFSTGFEVAALGR